MKVVLSKIAVGLCMVPCIFMAFPSHGVAGGWIEIRTDDETLFVTPGNWRITQWNPSSSSVIMAYFIPADGSVHAVILTHVMYGGSDGKTVAGVMGTCRSPRNGAVHTIAFER